MRFPLLFLLTTAALAQPHADPQALKALVEREAQRAGTSAVLFGLWHQGREVLTMATGHSMATVPATTSMHWRIGGMTETFQSVLLLKLAEQGRIRLDDTIDRWFPDLLAAKEVTVRMLAGNTAGYPDYVRRDDFGNAVLADPFRTFTDDELIAYAVKDGKMNYPPGTSQAYSHSELVILGQVIQRATGQSMRELYEENILKPLGLNDTQFPTTQEIQAPVLHSFTSDRNVYEDATCWNPSWASATGALTSNLRDLGKWAPVFGKGQLLSAESHRAQTAFHPLGKNRPDLYFAYGFVVTNGWYVQNPNMNGYSGGFAYHPKEDLTVIVAATKNRKPAIDPAGIHILREVIKHVTPATPLTF